MKNFARFLFLAFAVVTLMIPTFASAVTGPRELFIEQTPESVCRVVIREPQGFTVCTGTLYEADRVLTAAHCFGDQAPTSIQVDCGFSGFNPSEAVLEKSMSGNAFYLQGPKFKETTTAAIRTMAKDRENVDQVVLQLDRKISISPMRIANSEAVNTNECYLSGYGLSEKIVGGTARTGRIPMLDVVENSLIAVTDLESKFVPPADIIRKSPVNQRPLTSNERRMLIQASNVRSMSTLVGTPGDSGATVHCRDSKSGETTLTAVYSRTQEVALGLRKNIPSWQLLARAIQPDLELLKNSH